MNNKWIIHKYFVVCSSIVSMQTPSFSLIVSMVLFVATIILHGQLLPILRNFCSSRVLYVSNSSRSCAPILAFRDGLSPSLYLFFLVVSHCGVLQLLQNITYKLHNVVGLFENNGPNTMTNLVQVYFIANVRRRIIIFTQINEINQFCYF